VYGIAGNNSTDIDGVSTTSSEGEFGVGIRCNLLSHELLDPLVEENWLRVNAGAQYSVTRGDWGGEEQLWHELSGSLTLHILNEIDGNPLFNPVGIALFAGPAYSNYEGDVDENSSVGFIGGIEIVYSERIFLSAGIEQFDGPGFLGSLHVRF
jgi:hypothetical protein